MRKRYNKKQGIQMLKIWRCPTVELVQLNQLTEDLMSEGISVRLYHKSNKDNDLGLPSVHNCKSIESVHQFIDSNKALNYLMHRTVHPDIIGNISKIGREKVYILYESYDDFGSREKVHYRYELEWWEGNYYSIGGATTNCPEETISAFRKTLIYLNRIPHNNFTTEFVMEGIKPVFTDLIVEDD